MNTDDPQRPKRKATPRQLAYLARRRWQKKHWVRLWKTRREFMEGCRSKATLAASLKVADTNRWIAEVVAQWPTTFTAKELSVLCLDFPYHRKNRKRRMPHASLVRRLRLLGLMSYDPALGLWLNHAKPTQ